jgi:hypothetical protein
MIKNVKKLFPFLDKYDNIKALHMVKRGRRCELQPEAVTPCELP